MHTNQLLYFISMLHYNNIRDQNIIQWEHYIIGGEHYITAEEHDIIAGETPDQLQQNMLNNSSFTVVS